MPKIVISASSLPAGRNMSSQLEYATKVQNYGADMYHVDVMDGKFVKRVSIDYNYIEDLTQNNSIPMDVHLMVLSPSKSLIKKYAKAGSCIISLQYEAYEDKEQLTKCLKYIKKLGCMAGIACDLATPIEEIENYFSIVDLVLVLCVKAGAGGQMFNESALAKIKFVKSKNSKVLIEADGGINDETAPKCLKAGADILVSGNYIYNNDTYEAIQALKGKKNG